MNRMGAHTGEKTVNLKNYDSLINKSWHQFNHFLRTVILLITVTYHYHNFYTLIYLVFGELVDF